MKKRARKPFTVGAIIEGIRPSTDAYDNERHRVLPGLHRVADRIVFFIKNILPSDYRFLLVIARPSDIKNSGMHYASRTNLPSCCAATAAVALAQEFAADANTDSRHAH